MLQFTLDISRDLPKNSEKNAPYLARQGGVFAVFREFLVWKMFYLYSFHIVSNTVLFSTPIYREHIILCINNEFNLT